MTTFPEKAELHLPRFWRPRNRGKGIAGQLERFARSAVDLVDLRSAPGLLRVEATHRGTRLVAQDPFAADLFATHALADHAAFSANRKLTTAAMQEKFRDR